MTSAVPDLPPYDLATIKAQPFPERLRLICRNWAYQVNATPGGVFIGYVVKIALLYVGGWWFFCAFAPGSQSLGTFRAWAFEPVAFQKAVLWSILYEGLGVGCSSGPMNGRFVPPIGGVLYFLRPGTTKLPVFPGVPFIGGDRRTWLDVGLYVANAAVLVRALVAPEVTPAMLLPCLVLVPLLGVSDKTTYLAFRGEHYFVALACLVLAAEGELWIAACKVIWVAIWFFAATSKLNHHFPSIIAVMLTNSPLVPAWFHRRLWVRFPDDMRPSRLAATMAHTGTFLEYTFPMALLAGDGGALTMVALATMVAFHCFIAGNFPTGMPVEWNVMMVYGGFFLFGYNADASVLALGAMPVLLACLLVAVVAIPIYGNFVPSRVSFLWSMRYYAGNWAYSIWLFRGNAQQKLNRLTKAAPLMREQLEKIVDDEETIETAIMMTPVFRVMHLQGRVLHELLPRAVDDIDEYEWVDGEMVAGLAVGWNFGDGHLHGRQLLESIQAQCDFEPGELRVVKIESQPLFGSSWAWTIFDAATGVLEEGTTRIADVIDFQPWPTGRWAEAFVKPATDAGR